MIIVYIGAVLVASIILIIAILAIIWVSNSVTMSIRTKTLDVISQYDTLIEEKSEKLAILQNQVEILEKRRDDANKIAVFAQDEKAANTAGVTNSILNVVSSIGETKYKDEEVAETYRAIKKGFSSNIEKVVSSIPENFKIEKKNIYNEMLNKLTIDVIYALSTLSDNEQYVVLKGSLTEKEYKIYDQYYRTHDKVNILEFYDYLKQCAIMKNDTVTVVVPENTVFKVKPRGVKIRKDPSILEGYQIEKNNIVYDFSIKEKEIS